MTPEERKKKIKEHQEAIYKLLEECQHTFRILNSEQLADEWMSVSAGCIGCGQDFGWRCKESPDQVCHYFSEDGKVELIDGTSVSVPCDHDSDYETDDHCIFCGLPDERK